MIYFGKEKQTNLIQQAGLIGDCGNKGKRKRQETFLPSVKGLA